MDNNLTSPAPSNDTAPQRAPLVTLRQYAELHPRFSYNWLRRLVQLGRWPAAVKLGSIYVVHADAPPPAVANVGWPKGKPRKTEIKE